MAKSPPRPVRTCELCGLSDDHPRHVTSVGGTVKSAHIDCCADAGCDVCAATEAETGGLRGPQLIDHLTAARGK